LSNLHRRLTKGIQFWDWKTKWTDYEHFYSEGRQKELAVQIKELDPDAHIIWGSISRLEEQLEELENGKEIN
jgi:hypothetical protein